MTAGSPQDTQFPLPTGTIGLFAQADADEPVEVEFDGFDLKQI